MHNQPRHAAGATAAPRRKLGMPAKPKRWNHQDDLEALKGKIVVFTRNDVGGEGIGRLLEADAFALKLQGEDAEVIIWKHVLASIRLYTVQG